MQGGCHGQMKLNVLYGQLSWARGMSAPTVQYACDLTVRFGLICVWSCADASVIQLLTVWPGRAHQASEPLVSGAWQ